MADMLSMLTLKPGSTTEVAQPQRRCHFSDTGLARRNLNFQLARSSGVNNVNQQISANMSAHMPSSAASASQPFGGYRRAVQVTAAA